MSIINELRKLGRQRNGLQSLDEYYRQIDAEKNDRGAAILAVTFLEKALEYAISRCFPKRLTQNNYRDLFDNEHAPLGTFYAKILIADSLGIFGKQTLENLNLIKHIRNTFAHAVLPIDFGTKQIVDACTSLVLPKSPSTYRDKPNISTPREKFITICEDTSIALIAYSIKKIKIPAKELEPDDLMDLPVTPLP